MSGLQTIRNRSGAPRASGCGVAKCPRRRAGVGKATLTVTYQDASGDDLGQQAAKLKQDHNDESKLPGNGKNEKKRLLVTARQLKLNLPDQTKLPLDAPNTGWMLMRSLETLKLRMERAAQSAQTIADWLRAHPLVARTYYLTHLQHNPAQQDIYQRHCFSPGSMIPFDIWGGEADAFRFLNALQLIKLAVSLGDTESLAEHPGTMTHSDITLEEQAEMGITPQMIRLSIGVEDPQDLMLDLSQAFEAVGLVKEWALEMA